mmetsp:Transcript_120069/g.299515  ORF Transcript_120069/g.299515 Transcript_120069/m.299515 type:complete len:369 (+) Transcript_120069:1-1107(+)
MKAQQGLRFLSVRTTRCIKGDPNRFCPGETLDLSVRIKGEPCSQRIRCAACYGMKAQQAIAATARACTPQPRQHHLLPLGLLVLTAVAAERISLLCFSAIIPDRLVGHSAGRAPAMRGKVSRITMHEAMDYPSARLLSLSHESTSPKRRLLWALLGGRGGEAEVQELVTELLMEGQGVGVAGFVDRTWHLLSCGLSDSRFPAPQLEFYKGGNFLYEGSIQNGGLFKAVLQKEAAQLKLGIPRVTFSGLNMEVSASVEVAPGREKTLSYSAQFRPLSPTTFQRTLTTYDLPDPAGSYTPLVEMHDIVEVAFSDDDLLILRDESGHAEILVQNLAEALVLRSKSGDFVGLSDFFFDSPAMAISHSLKLGF